MRTPRPIQLCSAAAASTMTAETSAQTVAPSRMISPNVLTLEQFALDACDGVAAFASGRLKADSGATTRGEFNCALLLHPRSPVVVPYVYATRGWDWMQNATEVEGKDFIASAIGIGARLAHSHKDRAEALGFEVFRKFRDILGPHRHVSASLTAGSRF